MAAGLSSMNGLYGSYGMQNSFNNPYFLQAFNAPNANQVQAQQQAYSQQMANTAQNNVSFQGAQVANPNNISVQGAQATITEQAQEKESGGNGLAWALGIGVTLVGAGWWLASRGKGRGAEGLWNQIKTGFTSLFDKSADAASKITVKSVNGKNVFSLPNKVQNFKGAEAIAKSKELGIAVNEGLKWTDEAAEIARYKFDLKDGDDVIRVTVNNIKGKDKLVFRNVTKGGKEQGKILTSVSEELQKQVDNVVDAVSKKDPKAIPTGIEVKDILYASQNNGTTSIHYNGRKAATNSLKYIQTNKFLATDDAVLATMNDNATFKQAVENLSKNDKFEGWSIAEALYSPTGVKNASGTVWPANTSLKIENDKVAGIVENGKVFGCDSDKFKALKEQFGEVFEKAMEKQNDFTDIVRALI